MTERALLWLGSSRSDLQAFPRDARRLVGFQLRLVQQGVEPFDWKPMPGIGAGVQEVRIHTAVEYWVCYVAKFAEAIYVLHAFKNGQGKPRGMTWNSPDNDIALWSRIASGDWTRGN